MGSNADRSSARRAAAPSADGGLVSVTLACKHLKFDTDCALCLRHFEPQAGVTYFLHLAALGREPVIPHLPDPIRRHIHGYAIVDDEKVRITLRCGHRMHERCLRHRMGQPHGADVHGQHRMDIDALLDGCERSCRCLDCENLGCYAPRNGSLLSM